MSAGTQMKMQDPQPPKAPIANWIKWTAVLTLGAVIGLGNVFAETTFPGWWELARHAGGGMVTAATGLMVSLNR